MFGRPLASLGHAEPCATVPCPSTGAGARNASGHAAAVLPSPAMNSRRRINDPRARCCEASANRGCEEMGLPALRRAMSLSGPTLPTWALQHVVGKAARDPQRTSAERSALPPLDADRLHDRSPFLVIGRPFALLRIDATYRTPTWRHCDDPAGTVGPSGLGEVYLARRYTLSLLPPRTGLG